MTMLPDDSDDSDDQDTRFISVADLERESQNVKHTTVIDKTGTYSHVHVPGETGQWVRMSKEYTMQVKP